MTEQEAANAMDRGYKVQSGEGDDHDIGLIHTIEGGMAFVAWESGVATPCPVSDLERV